MTGKPSSRCNKSTLSDIRADLPSEGIFENLRAGFRGLGLRVSGLGFRGESRASDNKFPMDASPPASGLHAQPYVKDHGTW